jgi:glyoxylase-like metal-dependent hydrolase (beta-lactamase superfamily II)
VSADHIDVVLASHLHFDHAGGLRRETRPGQSGQSFPAPDTWHGRQSGRTPRIPTSGIARVTSPRTSSP